MTENGNFHPTLLLCLKELEALKGPVCYNYPFLKEIFLANFCVLLPLHVPFAFFILSKSLHYSSGVASKRIH